jgi:hypothetical protein
MIPFGQNSPFQAATLDSERGMEVNMIIVFREIRYEI